MSEAGDPPDSSPPGSSEPEPGAPELAGKGGPVEVQPKPKPKPSNAPYWILLVLAIVAGVLLWWRSQLPVAGEPGSPGASGATGSATGVAPKPRPPLKLSGRVGLEVEDAGSPTPKVVPPAQLKLECKIVAWQKGRKLGEVNSCDDNGGWELLIDDEVNGAVAVETLVPGRLRGVLEIEVEGRGSFELPELALGIGYPLTGQVLDSAREPLAGVQVQAMPEPNLNEPEPWRAVSDAQGMFSFDTLPAGPVNLNGSKGGYASSVVDAIAPGDEVLLVLDTLVALEGEVIADAEMISRARVRLEGSAVWPPIDKALGEGVKPPAAGEKVEPGAFAFPELVDGVYGVEVYVPAENPGEPEFASIPLENVEPSMHVSLALVRAFRVPVEVVDPDQKPVPNARVSLSYGTIAMLQKRALADLDGKARVGPVVPGPYWLRAEADGYLPALPQPVDVTGPGAGAEPLKPVQLVLARPATLRGRVTDERGNPVADAEVWLDADEPFLSGESQARAGLLDAALGLKPVGALGVTTGPVPPIPTADEPDLPGYGASGARGELGFAVRTEDDGSFEVTMLPPGEYTVRARHGGHAESRSFDVDLSSGEVYEGVELVLREGQPLTGRVLDANGQPVLEALVQVGDELMMVDESGAFDAGLRRGRVEVVVRAPGMVPVKKKVRLTKRAIELEFELEPADGRVELRIVDANGRPIENAEVMIQADDGLSPTAITWSDDAGMLDLTDLTKGDATLRIEHPDYVPVEKTVTVAARTSRREFVLDQGWVLEVLVRAEGSGERLADAEVDVDGQVIKSDKQGMAVVPRLQGAKVEVKVRREGWGRASASARRPKDAPRGELTVELQETGALSGQITDDIGDPVGGAKVKVYDDEGELRGQATSKADGSFSVLELPQGPVQLRVQVPASLAPELSPIRENSDVRRGQTTSGLQLRFERP